MRSIVFMGLGIVAFALPVVSQVSTTRPSFEVATIKPSTAARPRIANQPGGRYVATGVSLQLLMSSAYRGQQFQFSSPPNWLDSDLWDIEAKAPEGIDLTVNPFDLTVPDTMALMVQSLLEDRFQMKMRRETKEMPVYELVVAKSGPKMKLSGDQSALKMPEPGAAPPPRGGPMPRGLMRMGRGELEVSAISFQNLVQTLQAICGRPVIDKTGLKGLYDVKLNWAPDTVSGTSSSPFGPAVPGSAAPPSDPAGPSIFAALQEQLGLRLDSAKAPIEVLVIDSVQKPRPN